MEAIQVDPRQYAILIVDDNTTNLKVIVSYLREFGFRILTASSGESALKRVAVGQPDIILLDIMMPGIDGFETCRRLKADEKTADIPIIFMTALATTADKITGFEVGGVDYVTKPIQQEEVLARVKTHLMLQAQRVRLQQMADQLQAANQELMRLNADKDRLFSIVAHDLRSPFQPVLGLTKLLSRLVEKGDASPADLMEISQSIHRSAQNIHNLLENLLQWGRAQLDQIEHQPAELELTALVEKNLSLLGDVAANKDIRLHHTLPPEVTVYADENMLDAVIRNLISNALKFTPTGGQVTISARPAGPDCLAVAVADTGVGIAPEDLAKLFQIGVTHSTQGTDKERGTGLGLIICREMVERNGGQIWIESEPGEGTTVNFTIPSGSVRSPLL